jgi:hypothetical protein
MDILRKFNAGQQLEVLYGGRIQKAEIKSVGNFYVIAEIDFKEYRLEKEELLEYIKQAKQKKNEDGQAKKVDSKETDETTKD